MGRRNSLALVASRLSAATNLFSLLSILFVPASFPFQLGAQTPTPTDEDEVLRVTTDLILFPARIRDQHGQRPNGLTERDLSLKDPDGVTTRLYLSSGADRVAMIFALDQSGSVRDIILKQKEAALGLFARFSNKSSIAVLHFAETPVIAAPFARDSTLARSAFETTARVNQHTAIFDAAAKAIEMFETLPRVRSERRIVILISDGLDNASRTKPSKVIEAAREKRVSFYLIHLPLFEPRDNRLVVRRPSKGFADLAVKTGGVYLYPGETTFNMQKTINLEVLFQAIENDLKSQYLIGFYLGERAHDGKQHNLSLSLPAGIEYQVADRGYATTHKFVVH
jgi:Ca-activated chloride channel family protein